MGIGNSLFIKDFVYDLFCEYVGYTMEDELFAIYPQIAKKILMEQWETRCRLYNLNGFRIGLSSQRFRTFCEYYTKMTLASHGMNIYSAEVDDHGIDFVAEKGTKFLKFQVKSIGMDNTSKYVFGHKEHFKIAYDLLYMHLILLRNGEHP